MSRSDGSTASYYELPEGCSELQDLISHRDMNAQVGEIFRACYRYGIASHSDRLRDAKKMRFYADAEIKRLEAIETRFAQTLGAKDVGYVEPATSIDDESPRAQAIGQNGNTGEHYEDRWAWVCAPGWATHLMQRNGQKEWAICEDGSYYDDYDTSDAGRFLLIGESQNPWTVIEARPCQ